jgi:hypothetical protein
LCWPGWSSRTCSRRARHARGRRRGEAGRRRRGRRGVAVEGARGHRGGVVRHEVEAEQRMGLGAAPGCWTSCGVGAAMQCRLASRAVLDESRTKSPTGGSARARGAASRRRGEATTRKGSGVAAHVEVGVAVSAAARPKPAIGGGATVPTRWRRAACGRRRSGAEGAGRRKKWQRLVGDRAAAGSVLIGRGR